MPLSLGNLFFALKHLEKSNNIDMACVPFKVIRKINECFQES